MKLKIDNKTIRDDDTPRQPKKAEEKEPSTPPMDITEQLAFCEENNLAVQYLKERTGIRCQVFDTDGELLTWGRGYDQTRALINALKDYIGEEEVRYENTSAPAVEPAPEPEPLDTPTKKSVPPSAPKRGLQVEPTFESLLDKMIEAKVKACFRKLFE